MSGADRVITTAEIIRRIKADLKNPPNRIEGSFAADNVQAVGQEFGKYYAYVEWLHDMHYAMTAEGDWLDKKGAEVGVFRKQMTRATGEVTFYGKPGTQIPIGTEVWADPYRYRTTLGGMIAESEITLPVEAIEGGITSNIGPDMIFGFDSIPGLEYITNKGDILGGAEVETDEEYRERILIRMRYPGTSGNQWHYMHWAREVSGVGRVKIFPLWDGPGTVKVSILDANQRKATPELIEAVRSHIDGAEDNKRMGEGLAPIGALLTVSTAEEVPINVRATIVGVDKEVDTAGVKDFLVSFMADYFEEMAYDGRRVTVAKITDLLLAIDAVADVTEIYINEGEQSIILGEEQIPVVGEVIINGQG